MPHFCAFTSIYLIIFTSLCENAVISLQASSGGACRSLACLIAVPRFSASWRSGMKPFMQSSPPGGPACCGGAKPPLSGAAPADGKPLGAPLTGGNGDPLCPPPADGNGDELAGAAAPFGSGAGNAPWARTSAT